MVKRQRLSRRKKPHHQVRNTLDSPEVKKCLEKLQRDFVFVPTDKASGNIAVVCKKFYIEQSMRELGIFQNKTDEKVNSRTYTLCDQDSLRSIVKDHEEYMKSHFDVDDIPKKLPFLYWIPKMHKKPNSKQRFIAASHDCSTKPLSAIMTKVLKLVEAKHRLKCKRYATEHGINPMWIINNSGQVHECIASSNHKSDCHNIRTYDFSTLYTSIPHSKLKERMAQVIRDAFEISGKSFISVYKTKTAWTDSPKKNTLHMNCEEVIESLNWLIDNIYVTFGDKCFRQIIGIPMGTDCAPFLANLFLYSYEYEWIDKQRKQKNFRVLLRFKACCRYIDDLFLVNNDDLMKKYMSDIYPTELKLVPDESDGKKVPFLDLLIKIEESRHISTSIYDKRDSFDFPIVNFPVLTGNIPCKSSYGVFVGELVRYARVCTYLGDFKHRITILVKKLKKQHFQDRTLRKTWLSFCDSHLLLIQKYGRSVLNVCDTW